MKGEPGFGDVIAGYRVDSLLGRGGMGVVYLAEDITLGRKAVVKLLAPELTENENFRKRFVRESHLAASIDHPNVLPIYQAGETNGLLYIAMRYVEGDDLRGLLEREGRLEPERALAIITQVARALNAAHSRGLVHRDVKPANILLTVGPEQTEHVYLTDFGLTKQTSSDSGLTGTGTFVGTIDYVSPEQIRGQPLDGRADIYALGCVLYECLTGQVPFKKEEEVAVMFAHLSQPTPSILDLRPDLPPGLDHVIARAMAKSKDDRYSTALAMAAEALAQLPTTVVAPSWGEAHAPPSVPTDQTSAGADLVDMTSLGPTFDIQHKEEEEEEARRLAAEEEARRLAAEEEARRRAEEEARQRAEEEARRLAAEEEARQRAEEAARQRAAEEEARQRAEEAARQRAAEEEARLRAEEAARQRAAEEEARLRAEEEEARLRAEQETRHGAGETVVSPAGEDAGRSDEPTRVRDSLPPETMGDMTLAGSETAAGTRVRPQEPGTGVPPDEPVPPAAVPQEGAPPPAGSVGDRKRRGRKRVLLGASLLLVLAAGVLAFQVLSRKSDQPPPVTLPIPSVEGDSKSDALATLSDAGLKPTEALEHSKLVRAGFVIRTTPSGGQRATPGAGVTVHVSEGPGPLVVFARGTGPVVDERCNRPILLDCHYSLFIQESIGSRSARRVFDQPSSDAPFDDLFPALSPDGSRIAFARRVDGNWDIFVAPVDGEGQLLQITQDLAIDIQPAWSPDGTQLAYVSSDRDPNPTTCEDCLFEIYIADVDTPGEPRNLSNDQAHRDSSPSWSSTDRIAFVSDRTGNRDIFVLDADGSGNPRNLTSNNRDADTEPSWSPQGDQIVFARGTPGNFDIYMMGANGESPAPLINTDDNEGSPAWSSDGSEIVFASGPGKGNRDLQMLQIASTSALPTKILSKDQEDESDPSF